MWMASLNIFENSTVDNSIFNHQKRTSAWMNIDYNGEVGLNRARNFLLWRGLGFIKLPCFLMHNLLYFGLKQNNSVLVANGRHSDLKFASGMATLDCFLLSNKCKVSGMNNWNNSILFRFSDRVRLSGIQRDSDRLWTFVLINEENWDPIMNRIPC
jgi:hypothetical protein